MAGKNSLTNINSLKEYRQNGDGTFKYDENGNLTEDNDRKISTIEYNLLNLPSKIFFEDGNIIFNVYAADGRKLSSYYVSKVTQNINPREKLVILELPRPIETTLQTINISDIEEAEGTHYINNFEYLFEIQEQIEDITYTRIHNSEGYYKDGDFYCYRKDHLGNNREVWNATQNQTVQVTNYYPSGLPWIYTTSQEQPYLYNGKEFVEMFGYDVSDLGMRGLQHSIMRFSTIDRLAEKRPWMSPYAFCSNNPVSRIDPNGDWDIKVSASTDRGKNPWAVLTAYDRHGNAVFRTVVKVRGTYKTAEEKVSRNRATKNGDTPQGRYDILYWTQNTKDVITSGKWKGTPTYGPNHLLKLWYLGGEGGTRQNMELHGGRSQVELADTWGCIRISDDDIKELKTITDGLESSDPEESPGYLDVTDDLEEPVEYSDKDNIKFSRSNRVIPRWLILWFFKATENFQREMMEMQERLRELQEKMDYLKNHPPSNYIYQ